MRKRSSTERPQEQQDEGIELQETAGTTSVSSSSKASVPAPLAPQPYSSSSEDMSQPQVVKHEVKVEVHAPPESLRGLGFKKFRNSQPAPGNLYVDVHPSTSKPIDDPKQPTSETSQFKEDPKTGICSSESLAQSDFILAILEYLSDTCGFIQYLSQKISWLSRNDLSTLPDISDNWELIQLSPEVLDDASTRIIVKVRQLQKNLHLLSPEDLERQKEELQEPLREIMNVCTMLHNNIMVSKNNLRTFLFFTRRTNDLKAHLEELCEDLGKVIWNMKYFSDIAYTSSNS